MKSDIEDAIANFVFQIAPDLTSRLEVQEESLSETECTNPTLGRWIDANGVNYLFSVLKLDDKDFAEMHPAMAHISAPERQRFAAELENHFTRCSHCSLARGYELELDARIELACRQNNKHLLQLLKKENEADLSEEGDHQNGELRQEFSTT